MVAISAFQDAYTMPCRLKSELGESYRLQAQMVGSICAFGVLDVKLDNMKLLLLSQRRILLQLCFGNSCLLGDEHCVGQASPIYLM